LNLDIYLKPTFFIDFDTKIVAELAESTCKGLESDLEKAVKLFYEVRDRILYNPYKADFSRQGMKASTALEKGHSFCMPKAALLAAVCRYVGIPARLGFADVKNHLTSEKLMKLFGSDLFVFHGYTDIFLEGKWVKATPAFNLSLCKKFKVEPLEFDGKNDSIFHEFDSKGNKHMEYIKYHGTFADIPYEKIMQAMKDAYPNALLKGLSLNISGSFEDDANI
jgi:transglutaminase-like putative cysteine protease